MTQEQRKNLAVLTLYVASLPPDYQHFDMASFAANGGKDGFAHPVRAIKHTCGTSACFAGHGPNSGILPVPNETWGGYVIRCFGCEGQPTWPHGNFEWLFSGGWPNDIRASVKRAAWYLHTGNVPRIWDEEEWDDDKEKYVTRTTFEAPEGWDSFTPDMELITRIAKGEA